MRFDSPPTFMISPASRKTHRQQREVLAPSDQVLRQDLRVEKVQMPHQSHCRSPATRRAIGIREP